MFPASAGRRARVVRDCAGCAELAARGGAIAVHGLGTCAFNDIPPGSPAAGLDLPVPFRPFAAAGAQQSVTVTRRTAKGSGIDCRRPGGIRFNEGEPESRRTPGGDTLPRPRRVDHIVILPIGGGRVSQPIIR